MTNVNEFLKKCTVLKNTTKKATNLLNKYNYSIARYSCRTLNDCYSSYSVFKAQAYEDIRKECIENGGYALTIPTYNSNTFSEAYIMVVEGVEWLIYHTHYNKYAIKLPDVF